jgi:hypothetical protein
LPRTFERYNKLNREAAREIVDFSGQRVKVRNRNASAADITAGA